MYLYTDVQFSEPAVSVLAVAVWDQGGSKWSQPLLWLVFEICPPPSPIAPPLLLNLLEYLISHCGCSTSGSAPQCATRLGLTSNQC